MLDSLKPTFWLFTLIISLQTKGGSLSFMESQTSQIDTINKQTKKLITGNVPAIIVTEEKKYSYQCRNKNIEIVLKELQTLTGQSFIYYSSDLRGTKPVTLNLVNASLNEILNALCLDQPIFFEFKHGQIYIKHRDLPAETIKRDSTNNTIVISGKVVDTASMPIPRATITTSQKESLTSDDNGHFTIRTDKPVKSLLVSSVGFKSKMVNLPSNHITIILTPEIKIAEAVIVNHKLIHQIDVEKPVHLDTSMISQQPCKNVARILSGLAPGVLIKETNGGHGTYSRIQIRSNSWVGPANTLNFVLQNEPLIILDHIPLLTILINQMPFMGGNPGATGSMVGGYSILRTLSSDEIESIEILKDADATATYGSKGANGVVIINTKKAKAGQPYLTININTGFAKARIPFNLLNTEQYVVARNEAFKNDNKPITTDNAPDLTTFGTNRNIDYGRYFLGGTAKTCNVHIATSGVIDNFGYRLALVFYKEGSILPANLVNKSIYDQDISIKGGLYQKSKNGKFSISFDGLYFTGKTVSITPDVTQAIRTPPNAPELTDSVGRLRWYHNFTNPLSYLFFTYWANIENVLSSCEMKFKINPNLTLMTNSGLTMLNVNERSIIPIAAQNPARLPTGTSMFQSTFIKNVLFELLAEYNKKFKNLSAIVLAGSMAIRQKTSKDDFTGTGYTSDLLLPMQHAAKNITSNNSIAEYGYVGFFINNKFAYRDQYLLNATFRVDGSSRFGPQNKYGFFWGIGGGWIIPKAKLSRLVPSITYAKIRATFGTTGNDGIGDYTHRGGWANINTPRNYGGMPAYNPIGFENPRIGWGVCHKFEASLEATYKERLGITLSYYRNLYTNQLISQSVPNFSGIGSITKNSNVKTVSKGLEFNIQKKGNQNRDRYWLFSISGTIPKTKLKYFPNLESSNYANIVTVGAPLSAQKGLLLIGVNAQTGLYEFKDRDQNNEYTSDDYQLNGDLDPKFYGGFQNMIRYKQFLLDFCWDFTIQKGINQLVMFTPMKFTESGFSNIPVELLNHWQKPGDRSAYQLFSATPGLEAFSRLDAFRSSSAQLVNANFLRLKNICLSYTVKANGLLKYYRINPTFYISAENMILFTKYYGADPSAQNNSGLPILKRMSIGAKLQFN